MTDIIIAEGAGKMLSRYIAEKLAERYFVRLFSDNGISEFGRGYMLDILSCTDIRRISVTSGVVITDEYSCITPRELSGNLRFIVSSCNENQLAVLGRYGYPTVICGNYEKDTVSYSSVTDDRLTVSLNRNITALSGRVVRPFEIPIEYKPEEDIYSILALTALRILLDDFDSELGKLF